MTYAVTTMSVPDRGLADTLTPAGPELIPTEVDVSTIGDGAASVRIRAGRTYVGVATAPPDTTLLVQGNGPSELPLIAGQRVRQGVGLAVGPTTDIAIRLPIGSSIQVTYIPVSLVCDIADRRGLSAAHLTHRGSYEVDLPALEPASTSGAASLPRLASTLEGLLDLGPPDATRSKIDSSSIVRSCVAYVDSTGHVPTMRDLCLVAHVSERRLRTAFTETVGMPPTEFFRFWQLSRIRDVLAAGRESVTTSAITHGVRHHGRFSGRYHAVYGEYPRDTLAVARTPSHGRRRLVSVAS